MGFLHQVCVHTADDLILVFIYKIQCVEDIVRVEAFLQDGFIIVVILPDCGGFGGRVQDSSVNQEFGESIDIIPEFGKVLIRSKERVEPQFFKDTFQQDMREKLRVAEAVRAAFLD